MCTGRRRPFPIVVADDGRVLLTGDDILTGQQVAVHRRTAARSIWGHGAYQAPDWSADWLHREANTLLDVWAEAGGAASFAALDESGQAVPATAGARTARQHARRGRRRAGLGGPRRSDARTAAHYDGLYGGDAALAGLREAYAMQSIVVPDPARRALTAFFFWTSWASATNRPGQTVTYTNNWPHEPLIANR